MGADCRCCGNDTGCYCATVADKLAAAEAEAKLLRGHWDDAGHRCAQCGTGNPKVAAAEAEAKRLDEELGRERVQHAGCLIAAEGGKYCDKDAYGWSLAGQTTADLRAERDGLVQKLGLEEVTRICARRHAAKVLEGKPDITPIEQAAVLKAECGHLIYDRDRLAAALERLREEVTLALDAHGEFSKGGLTFNRLRVALEQNRTPSPVGPVGNEPAIDAARRRRHQGAARGPAITKAALGRCHRLLQEVVAMINPEDHNELVERIDRELSPCDEADACPTIKED